LSLFPVTRVVNFMPWPESWEPSESICIREAERATKGGRQRGSQTERHRLASAGLAQLPSDTKKPGDATKTYLL